MKRNRSFSIREYSVASDYSTMVDYLRHTIVSEEDLAMTIMKGLGFKDTLIGNKGFLEAVKEFIKKFKL